MPLFLTSKVRLHCDDYTPDDSDEPLGLFLTSKVRLHCDSANMRQLRIYMAFFS